VKSRFNFIGKVNINDRTTSFNAFLH